MILVSQRQLFLVENTYVGLVVDGGRLERSQRGHGAGLDGAASAANAGTTKDGSLHHCNRSFALTDNSFKLQIQERNGKTSRRITTGDDVTRRKSNVKPTCTGGAWASLAQIFGYAKTKKDWVEQAKK